MPTDVRIENHGTIFLFFAESSAAQDWIKQWVDGDYERTGGPLVVEHRFAEDITTGMITDGLEVV